jgi:hypothetical protein
MASNSRPGLKSPQVQQAALLYARRLHSPRVIARDTGLDYGYMLQLVVNPKFLALVEMHKEAIKAEAPELFVANRDNRLYALNNLFSRYVRLMEEREERHSEYTETGLVTLTEQVKRANGKEEVVSREYAFDAALDKAMRETLKQAAIERGEWQEKKELSGPGGSELNITAVVMELTEDDEESRQEDTSPDSSPDGEPDTGLAYRGDHW